MCKSIIIIDGKPQEFETIEEATKKIGIFTMDKDGKIYGFEKEEEIGDWVKKHNMNDAFEKLHAKVTKAKNDVKNMTQADKDKMKDEQVIMFKHKNEILTARLKELNINPSDIKALEKLHQSESGKKDRIFESTMLYDELRYGGRNLYYSPGYYPDLNFIGAGDIAESIWTVGGCWIFSDIWFRGWIHFYFFPSVDMGPFRNIASSLITL
jgi:hypothetical protein